jgi:hypothetical protein
LNPFHFFDHVAEFTHFSGEGGGPVRQRLIVVATKSVAGPADIFLAEGLQVKWHGMDFELV